MKIHNRLALVGALMALVFGSCATAQPPPDTGPPQLLLGAPDDPVMAPEAVTDPMAPVLLAALEITAPEHPAVVQDVPEFQHPMMLAHSGQLSPKDDCHNHKKAGERHWHRDGTSERGGPCVTQDGDTYRLTKHDICAKERILLVRESESYWGNYEAAAEALKNCIISLDSPPN